MKRKPLDEYTVRWFMRRIRAKEREHKRDAQLCESLGNTQATKHANGKAFSFGLFGDLVLHEARAISKKSKGARKK